MPEISKQLFPSVRPMLKLDLTQVLDIETDNNCLPWMKDDFCRFMGCSRTYNKGIIAEYREQVIGFALYQVLKPKSPSFKTPSSAGHRSSRRSEVVVTEISVRQDYRRRGVGASLVDYIIAEAKRYRSDNISYFVLEDNLPGQLFLRSCEFLARKIHRGYYEGIKEDVYEMRMEVVQENDSKMQVETASV